MLVKESAKNWAWFIFTAFSGIYLIYGGIVVCFSPEYFDDDPVTYAVKLNWQTAIHIFLYPLFPLVTLKEMLENKSLRGDEREGIFMMNIIAEILVIAIISGLDYTSTGVVLVITRKLLLVFDFTFGPILTCSSLTSLSPYNIAREESRKKYIEIMASQPHFQSRWLQTR